MALGKAWRYLAQPAHTRFDKQEMRQQMKLVELKLRIALQKAAARDRITNVGAGKVRPLRPDWRLLNIDVRI